MRKIVFILALLAPFFVKGINAPNLSSPSDGAQLSVIAPSLEWNTVSGASSYQIQCDTTQDFDSQYLVTSSSTSFYKTISGLYFGKTYYWRVRSCTATDTSAWSLVRRFTTIARPTLTSPSNGAQLSVIAPSLEWNSISGTSTYQIQCDTTEDFNSQYLVTSSSTSFYKTISGLYFGKTYYWRVRSCTATDTSAWSLVRTFTTIARPTLTSPSNGAQLSSISASLEWSSISGTSTYQIQCDTTEDFDSQYLVTSSSTTYYKTQGGLYFGKTYYWRVRSCTATDTSAWSLVRRFTTPATVTLSSPTNGSALSSLNTTLNWQSMSGVSGFQYQLDVLPTFNTNNLLNGTATSYYKSVSGLVYNVTYYWRVRAYTSVDTSAWSAVWTFTTNSLNMHTAPTLVSPASGSTAIPTDGQLFTWTSVPNTQQYQLEYATDVNFTNNIDYQQITNTSATLYDLMPNTTYYWRVRAINGVDFSPWSMVWNFTTNNCTITADETLTLCANEIPYLWNGLSLTAAGTYSATLPSLGGCDSVVTLQLVVNPVAAGEEDLTICQGQTPYVWNGQTLTAAGDYQATLLAANGCDSIVTLHLTVVNAYNSAFSVTACDSYTWNNETYTATGNYTQTFQNAVGCDSVVTLNLTISDIIYTTIDEFVCGSYFWNGQLYTQTGTYEQQLTSLNGCDSIVILNLTIGEPVYDTIFETSCGNYLWNNEVYTTTGTYQQSLIAANGCDSIVTLHLTVLQPVATQEDLTICASDLPYTWNDIVMDAAGTQTVTLATADGCDSIVTLHLTVNPTYNVDDYLEVSASDLPYSWNGVEFAAAGSQSVVLTSAAGCDSTVNMYLSVTDTVPTDTTGTSDTTGISNYWLNVRCYPNPANAIVTVEAAGLQQIAVFDAQGRLVDAITVGRENSYRLNTRSWAPGIYFLQVQTEQGRASHKIVIQR